MLDGHKIKYDGFEEEKNNRLQIPRKTQGPAGIPRIEDGFEEEKNNRLQIPRKTQGPVGIPRIPKKGLGNDPIENFKI